MSPIMRQVASRRTFSILSRARQVARGFEPHPFERMPKAQEAAPADYKKLAKRVGGVAMIYFPWYAVVLGWPLAAEKMVGQHL
ncbi:pantothenate transporter liz1 protein [Rutstroemia sp. NJR-2017a BVV2]|nr:pantothenate transporter liz1 protein [Rutstroemia sp. NJR-2017a BVV2]